MTEDAKATDTDKAARDRQTQRPDEGERRR